MNRLSGIIFVLMIFVAPFARAVDIHIYGLFPNMVILEVKGKQHKLRVGETTPEGIKLISADSEKAVLEIKGKRQQYGLGERIAASVTTDTQQKAEARIWPQHGMYAIPGAINNQAVHFLVDTGATWVVLTDTIARKLGINFRYEGKPGKASTANGVVDVYLIRLQTVQVGEIELTNVDGAVIVGQNSNEVLLGASFLNRVNLYREGQMMLLREK